MARHGFGRIDPGVISGKRDEQRAANATIGRTRLLVALSCGGHTAEEFEMQKHTKGEIEYQCLLDNACTNRIIGHIGECYKRTEIEKNGVATGKVRCRCVPAPDGASSIRGLLDVEIEPDDSNRAIAMMKTTIEWIFARVAHEASVELGMIKHSNRASVHRIRRYYASMRMATDRDPWPRPSLDTTVYWSEYRKLFLDVLVENTIVYVLHSLPVDLVLAQSSRMETVASIIQTTRDSYNQMLRERKNSSMQKHLDNRVVLIDYAHFDLEAPVRTTDMTDDDYDTIIAVLNTEKSKTRLHNATTIIRFWGSHCSECTRGAKRKEGSSSSSNTDDPTSRKRDLRVNEHNKLVGRLRDERSKWDRSGGGYIVHSELSRSADEISNITWIDALIGLIETIAKICKLVKECTREIRESDIRERNERIENQGKQRKRHGSHEGALRPGCAKSVEANKLIMEALKHAILLMRSCGVGISLTEQEHEARSIRTEIKDSDQTGLVETIRSALIANVSNKLTGLSLSKQKQPAANFSKVDDLVRNVLVSLVDQSNQDDTVVEQLGKKKPREVLERALFHLFAKKHGDANQPKAEYTSKRGARRQRLDDAEQCTIKIAGSAEGSDRVECFQCKQRQLIVERRQRFARGKYLGEHIGRDSEAKADARSLLDGIERTFVDHQQDGFTLQLYVTSEVAFWIRAIMNAQATEICLCATLCQGATCAQWRELWRVELLSWFDLDGSILKDVVSIRAQRENRSKDDRSKSEHGRLVREFLVKWKAIASVDDSGDADPSQESARGRRKEGAAGRAEKQTRKKRKGSTDGDQDIDGVLRVLQEEHAQERAVTRDLKSACDRILKSIRKRNVDLIQTDKEYDAMSRADLFGLDSKLREANLWDEYKALDIFDNLRKYLKRRVDFEHIESNVVGEETKGRKKMAFVAAYAMCMQQTIPVPQNVRWVVARLKRESDEEIARDAATKEAYALVTKNPEFAFQDDFRDENDIKWITENALADVLGVAGSEYQIADILDKMVRTPDSFAKLEPKIEEQVVKKCIEIYKTLRISKNIIRGPRGENVQIAMWVLANGSSFADPTDSHRRMMNRASLYFYLYGDERSGTVTHRDLHGLSLFGSEEIHGRVKRFVSEPNNKFFSTSEGLAVKQYIYGITPLGEKEVPLKVVGKKDVLGRTGPSKKATTRISDDTIIMYPSDGAITLDMLVNGYKLAHEEKLRDHINISMLSVQMGLLDQPTMYERHLNMISLVHVKYPELKQVKKCEDALTMLGEIYKSVIEQAEAANNAPKTVRLCSLVKTSSVKWYSANVERNLTVLALYYAFTSYRKHNGSPKLKYELYTADPIRVTIDSEYQDSKSDYEKAFRKVVLPDGMKRMMSDVDSEINSSDQSNDDELTEGILSDLTEIRTSREREQEEKERVEEKERLERQKAKELEIQEEEQERRALQARRNLEYKARLNAFVEEQKLRKDKEAQQKLKKDKEAQQKKAPSETGFEDGDIIDIGRLTAGGLDKTADDATGNKKAERKEDDPESLIQECDDSDTDEVAQKSEPEAERAEAGILGHLETLEKNLSKLNLSTFGASRHTRTSMPGKWI